MSERIEFDVKKLVGCRITKIIFAYPDNDQFIHQIQATKIVDGKEMNYIISAEYGYNLVIREMSSERR